MSHILHVDASPRAERSISRALSCEFLVGWKAAHPEDIVTHRDLGHRPVPHVTEPWIAAAYSSPTEYTPELAEAIRISDELVDELLVADRYVFGIPMYNFSVPSTFKAYIDQICRVGRTFIVDANGYKGLLQGKKLLVIGARGGSYQAGTPTATFDFYEPYLRTVFGSFLGVTDISFIYADGLAMGSEAREKAIASARVTIQTAITTW